MIAQNIGIQGDMVQSFPMNFEFLMIEHNQSRSRDQVSLFLVRLTFGCMKMNVDRDKDEYWISIQLIQML